MQYGGDCNICKQGARRTKQQLKKMGKEQVQEKMLELCGYAGSFSNACMTTVAEKSDVSLLNYFLKGHSMTYACFKYLGHIRDVDREF